MVLFELAVMGVGLFGLAYAYVSVEEGLTKRRQHTALANRTVADPGDVSDGETIVQGTVDTDDPIPVGPGGSVALRATVRQGDTLDEWNYIEDDAVHGTPFVLESDGERVAVEPTDIDFELLEECTYEQDVDAGQRPSGVLGEYADWRGFDLQTDDGDCSYELERVAVGDAVTVCGQAEQRNGRTVVTDGDGPFFVTNDDTEALRSRRKHALKKELLLAAVVGCIGAGVFLAGLLFLFV